MKTDREKLINWIKNTYVSNSNCVYKATVDDTAAAIIADMLIDNGVVVQKRGWIKVYQNAMYPYSCSECGNCHARKVNFCERCGTKLDLPEPPKEDK